MLQMRDLPGFYNAVICSRIQALIIYLPSPVSAPLHRILYHFKPRRG